jgi:hypothetical protein
MSNGQMACQWFINKEREESGLQQQRYGHHIDKLYFVGSRHIELLIQLLVMIDFKAK